MSDVGYQVNRHVQQIRRVLDDEREVVVATVSRVGDAHDLAERWERETGQRHFVREVIERWPHRRRLGAA